MNLLRRASVLRVSTHKLEGGDYDSLALDCSDFKTIYWLVFGLLLKRAGDGLALVSAGPFAAAPR